MNKLPSRRIIFTHLRPENLPRSIFKNKAKVSADFNILKANTSNRFFLKDNSANFQNHSYLSLAISTCLFKYCHSSHLTDIFVSVSTSEMGRWNKSSSSKMYFDTLSYGRHFMVLSQVRASVYQVSERICIFVIFPHYLNDE